jgi:alpha-tubulin suppressor-like RCC1 family protein
VLCLGFTTAPLIRYSENIKDTKIYIEYDTATHLPQHSSSIVSLLLTPDILKSLCVVPVNAISFGFEHAIALTSFGTVASWGYGASGALGHGNYTSYTAPKLVQSL